MRIRDLCKFVFALELKDKLATLRIHCDDISEDYLDIQSWLSKDVVDQSLSDIIPNFAWNLEVVGRKTKGTIRIPTTDLGDK